MKTKIVRINMIIQGLFLDKSFKSWLMGVLSVLIEIMRSRVVRKVIIRQITPTIAKINITFSKPFASSPCPIDSAKGRNND